MSRIGVFNLGCNSVRAESRASIVATRSTNPILAIRKSRRMSSGLRELCCASSVFRLVRSAVVRSAPSLKKSSTRVIHSGSRSSKCPACSCADHLLPGFAVSTTRDTPRISSSSRAGVPRNRTHKLGYCSTGNVNSNFLSNHGGTRLTGHLTLVARLPSTSDARQASSDADKTASHSPAVEMLS